MSNGNFTDLSTLLQSGTSFDLQNSTYTYSAATDSALVNGITFTGTESINIDGKTSGVIDGASAARIFDSGTATLELKGLTLQNGLAQYGAAVMSEGSLTLLGSTFTGNTSTTSGGVVYSSKLLQSTNSVFSKNVSNYGGAIFSQGTASFASSTFSGNTAIVSATTGSTTSSGGYGGVFYNYNGSVIFDSSEIKGNVAKYQGGFLYNYGYGTVASSNISENVSEYGGGAISNDGIAIVQGSTISSNTATSFGGAINSSYMLIASSNTFSGNTAAFGGAVINFYQSTSSYDTYRGNTATTSGGALYNEETANVNDALFDANNAIYGGAVMNNGTISVSASTFANNTAISSGTSTAQGGALANYGTATVTTSVFQANTASGDNTVGGALKNSGKITISASTFTDNYAELEGGAAENVYILEISTSSFSGNRAALGAAIFNSNTCTATGNVFSNNVAFDAATGGNSGGAIYNEYILNLTANTFTANTAKYGSAIFNTGIATLENNLVQGNTATYSSGALESYYAANLISNTISDNAAMFGGAIMNSGYVYASSNTFANNTAFQSSTTGGSGGAIYFGTASSGIANNNIFTGNKAVFYGGAIYVQAGNLQFDSNTISSNTAAYGGAVFNSGTLTSQNNSFTANIATSGGAVYENGTHTLSNNMFSGNTASYAGGAIYADKNLTVDGGTFSANIANGITTTESTTTFGGYGGAIANYGTGNVSNALFSGNTAINGGAIIGGSTAQTVINGNTFTENLSTFGGAIMDFGNSEITANTFSTNTGALSGGAIYSYAGKSDISDNTFAGNKAVSGAAIYVDDQAEAEIDSNVFTSNVATGAGGGGVYITGDATISNNTFNMNGAIWGGAICSGGTAEATLTNNDFMANYAYYGGAVCNYDTTNKMTFKSSNFYNNLALKSSTTGGLGGAVYNKGVMNIEDSTFRGNTSSYIDGATVASTEKSGGAIYNDETGVLTLANTSFLTNSDSVYNKGSLTISGTVSFASNFTSENEVKAEKNACVVIDLSSNTKGNDVAIISQFANVADSDIKLVVSFSGRREVGTYVLAEDVTPADLAGVEFSVSIADLQHALGVVTYGTAAEFGNDTYELMLSEGVLSVQVSTVEVLTESDKKITVAKDDNLSTAKDLTGILSVAVKKNGVFSGAGIETDGSKNASFTIEDNGGYISNAIVASGTANFSVTLKNNAAFVVYGKVDGFQKISAGKNALVDIKGAIIGDELKSNSISFGTASKVTFESTVKLGSLKNSLSLGANSTLSAADSVTGVNTLTVSSGTQVTQADKTKTQERTTLSIEGDLIGNETYDNILSVGDYADVDIEGKIANDDFSTQIKVGANSTLEIGDAVQRIKSLSISAGKEYKPVSSGAKVQGITEVTIGGDITGTEVANTVSLGNFGTFTANSIDLKDGKNVLSLGGRDSNVSIEGAVLNVYSLKTGNGGVYKNTAGTKELQNATLSIQGKLVFANFSDTLSIGKYAQVSVGGNISTSQSGNIAITIGSNGTLTAKKISAISKLTLSDSASYTVGTTTVQGQTTLTADALEGTDANNAFSFGKSSYTDLSGKIITGKGNDTLTLNSYAVVKTTCIEFGETSKNSITVKQGAQLAVIEEMTTEKQVNGDILNVNTLTVKANSGQTYYALFAKKITGSSNNDTFSFDSYVYAQVDNINFKTGNNKLKLGSSSSVQLTGAVVFGDGAKNELSVGSQATFSCTTISGVNKITTSAGSAPTKKADAVYTNFTANAVTATDGNDTFSFGNYTETSLGDLTFGTGNDTLKIGSNAYLNAGKIDFGEGKDSLSIGSYSDVRTGDVSGLNKLTLSAGKAGNEKKGVLNTYTHAILGAVTGTAENDTFSIGNYADCVITGTLDLGDGAKDNITLGSNASLAIAGDTVSNVSKIDLGKTGILGLNSTMYDEKDDLNIVGKGEIDDRIYDIGTAAQAKCFSGFGTELNDNALTTSESELQDGSNGWLCAEKEGEAYFADAIDYFSLEDVTAAGLGSVTITNSDGALVAYLFTQDDEGTWDEGTYIGYGTSISFSGVSDVSDYRIAVTLADGFTGITTYAITIA